MIRRPPSRRARRRLRDDAVGAAGHVRRRRGGRQVDPDRAPRRGAAPRASIRRDREPGTPGAERSADCWSRVRRALAAAQRSPAPAAARYDHVVRRIARLGRRRWVLCDRFMDSTRVYQGVAGAVGEAVIDRLHASVLGDLRPDLTVILDVPVATGSPGARGRPAGSATSGCRRVPCARGFLAGPRRARALRRGRCDAPGGCRRRRHPRAGRAPLRRRPRRRGGAP